MIVITQEITNEEIRFHCGMKLITLHIRALLYDWYSVPARKKERNLLLRGVQVRTGRILLVVHNK